MLRINTILPCQTLRYYAVIQPQQAPLTATNHLSGVWRGSCWWYVSVHASARGSRDLKGVHLWLAEWWASRLRELQQPVLDRGQWKQARISTLTCLQALSLTATKPLAGPLSPQWSGFCRKKTDRLLPPKEIPQEATWGTVTSYVWGEELRCVCAFAIAVQV